MTFPISLAIMRKLQCPLRDGKFIRVPTARGRKVKNYEKESSLYSAFGCYDPGTGRMRQYGYGFDSVYRCG